MQDKISERISPALIENYFHNLVNQFFKILPMSENKEESLSVYMESLQAELTGCKSLIPTLRENSMFLSLLAILQFLIEFDERDQKVIKREVFKAISLCNKLQALYKKAG